MWPSLSQRLCARILRNNFILDCQITIDDWKRAQFLYGPDVATLKGRTVQKRSQPSSHNVPIRIPFSLLRFHGKVQLAIDFVHIQGLPFLHTISREWRRMTLRRTPDRSAKVIHETITELVKFYAVCQLNIVTIHRDNAFACMHPKFPKTYFNMCAANEHVGDIERSWGRWRKELAVKSMGYHTRDSQPC